MAEIVESTGKTVEDALAAALDKLGCGRSEVTYEIIQEPSSGFLGLWGSARRTSASRRARSSRRSAAKRAIFPPPPSPQRQTNSRVRRNVSIPTFAAVPALRNRSKAAIHPPCILSARNVPSGVAAMTATTANALHDAIRRIAPPMTARGTKNVPRERANCRSSLHRPRCAPAPKDSSAKYLPLWDSPSPSSPAKHLSDSFTICRETTSAF